MSSSLISRYFKSKHSQSLEMVSKHSEMIDDSASPKSCPNYSELIQPTTESPPIKRRPMSGEIPKRVVNMLRNVSPGRFRGSIPEALSEPQVSAALERPANDLKLKFETLWRSAKYIL